MKKQAKNLLAVAGIISMVMGVTGSIPFFLQEKYSLAIVSTLFIIGGLVLLAIAFGD